MNILDVVGQFLLLHHKIINTSPLLALYRIVILK